jgi:excisionase family DNA binding protein
MEMARRGGLKHAIRIDAASDEARSASLVAEAIAGESGEGVVLSFPDGRSVALPATLVEVVRASADELASGQSITVLPLETILTPAEAAELLGLSRPFVARLLDAGEIESERLPGSRHRRVRLADVLAFNARRQARREGRRRIGEALSDAGLPH